MELLSQNYRMLFLRSGFVYAVALLFAAHLSCTSARAQATNAPRVLNFQVGRFEIVGSSVLDQAAVDRAMQGDVARQPPSAYLKRFYYDTILHDPSILRWLAERVSVERIALGSDYSFPPADLDPLATVRAAGFSAAEIHAIAEDNPRTLFPLLK